MKTLYKFKFIIVILILFVIFLILYLYPRNYNIEYKVNGITISETYEKDKRIYKFGFKYKNNNFKLEKKADYKRERKRIQNIEVVAKEDFTCLVIESDIKNIYPLCKKENEVINYHLIPELKKILNGKFYHQLDKIDDEYEGININSLNNRTYLIWNYTGIHVISQKGYYSVDFFDKDVYETPLAYLLNEYFIIPDAVQYRFNKIYIYNILKDELTEWNLKKYLYTDSYILGAYKKSLFLFDVKEKAEYEMVPHKKKIRNVDYKILTDGHWEKTSLQKLLNKSVKFTDNSDITYKIIDGRIYKIQNKIKEKISNRVVNEIISYNDNEVYYISKDVLYLHSNYYGEQKLMTNFEWNFNFNNKVFVY